jgi:HEAT repeat protein
MIVNRNAGIRSLAAMGLCHIGSEAPEAIPYLIKALQDRHLNTRYWAAQALGKHGSAAGSAVPALVEVLQNTFRGVDPNLEGPERYYADARAVAAESLGKIGKGATPAIPALQEALTDKSPEVRDAAAKALQEIEREANK